VNFDSANLKWVFLIMVKRKFFGLALVVMPLFLVDLPAHAASFDLTSLTYGTPTDGSNSTVNGITYRDESLPVTGFTANGNNWTTGGFPTPVVSIRRNSPGADNPNRQVVWSERATGDPNTTVLIGPPTTSEAAFNTNNIYLGADNFFVNTGNGAGNQSDIERIDYVISAGVTVDPTLGVVVLERGVSDVHDVFQIAAITAVDGSGLPTAFGNLLTITGGSWGTTDLRTPGSRDYTILNDSDGGAFINTANVNQNIGGVAITLDSLVTSGTTVFGYSIFGADVISGGNNNNLVDFTNRTFFPVTPDNTGVGGLDPVAANFGIAQVPFEFSPALGLVFLGGFWGLSAIRKSRKSAKSSEDA